jgi:hypothetical protein
MKTRLLAILAGAALAVPVALASSPTPAAANHSWGGYHWARTANPFSVTLIDSVTDPWNPYLATTSADWTASSVLDTTTSAGTTDSTTRRKCPAPAGQVRVCNLTYGQNGWLGIAQIWLSGSHITQGTVKLNDTYFGMSRYNTTPWRNLVSCQEVGHTFGLGHQDETFSNANLGTCMDYTDDPDGTVKKQPDNQHPNAHDFDELGIIYSHPDSTSTVKQAVVAGSGQSSSDDEGPNDPSNFGRPAGPKDGFGRDIVFLKDLPNGRRLVTHVFWALPTTPGGQGRR